MTNYQKLLNGRSAFGVVGGGKEPVDLGIVIVDDAHAALARTEDQFRLRVPAAHQAYGKLLELFADDLRRQSANAWARLGDMDPTALAPIAFWAWAGKRDRVSAAIEIRPSCPPIDRITSFVGPAAGST
ncbi:hypothetical protein ABZ553_37080 [Streptomyces sparsogenes]|uniref:hypothetical protein n=1 Tax=Streptomyces sparsogenes TaxID=67365 RepID=UPI00340C5B45